MRQVLPMSDESFVKTLNALRTRLIAVVVGRHRDPRRHFRFVTTSGWRVLNEGESGLPDGGLFSLGHDTQQSALISVSCTECDREVSPMDWLATRPEHRRSVILDRKDLHYAGGTNSWILYRLPSGRMGQANTVKDGKRIFLIACSSSAGDYPKLADDFALAIRTFDLLAPERRVLAEDLRFHALPLSDQPRFAFPASWSFDAEPLVPDTLHGMPAASDAMKSAACRIVAHDQGRWMGEISVFTRCRDDASVNSQKCLRAAVRVLESRHLRVRGACIIPLQGDKRFVGGCYSIVEAQSGGSDYECLVTVLERASYLLTLLSVGPTKQSAAQAWAVNRRAAEIIRESMRFCQLKQGSVGEFVKG